MAMSMKVVPLRWYQYHADMGDGSASWRLISACGLKQQINFSRALEFVACYIVIVLAVVSCSI